MASLKLGVIGDLHTHWDEVDVARFNASDYDMLLFTGDLGGGAPGSTLRIARVMSGLTKPTLVMPGNHDAIDISELAAELTHRHGLARLAGMRTGRRSARADVRLCGYSNHRFRHDTLDVTLLAGRPHSMGGPELAFLEHMRTTYDVGSLGESTDRLLALVDDVESEAMIFLSHNGPAGLGAQPYDMWGRDFQPEGGDWGDPDLKAALDHAVARGHRVLAVIAGHMHLRTASGAQRSWLRELDGVTFLNAARVPRIFNDDDGLWRHHVEVIVSNEGVSAREVLED